MRLNGEEQEILAGKQGPVPQQALRHQIKVGDFFGAVDFVPVTQAHIMADTESLGAAGVRWLEELAAASEGSRRVRIPTITDPRGTDFSKAAYLGQTFAMLDLERRTIDAFVKLGVTASLPLQRFNRADVAALQKSYRGDDNVDVVVFSAPQLSLYELRDLAGLCEGRRHGAAAGGDEPAGEAGRRPHGLYGAHRGGERECPQRNVLLSIVCTGDCRSERMEAAGDRQRQAGQAVAFRRRVMRYSAASAAR